MDEYLIQGTTLTNIANEIRSFGVVGTMTPDQMAGYISQVYDNGYEVGYADGSNANAETRPFAPIVIQKNATSVTPVIGYGVSGNVYNASDFENTTYHWQNDITEQVTAALAKLTLTVENKNPYLYVTVCVLAKYTHLLNGTVTNKYISVTVPPSSTNTAEQTFSRVTGSTSYEVTYLRYSIDGN